MCYELNDSRSHGLHTLVVECSRERRLEYSVPLFRGKGHRIDVLIYILGVQFATAIVNVPLNNRLQSQDLAQLDADGLKQAAEAFAPRWLLWNNIRTWLATFTTVILLIVLLRT